MKIPWAEPWLEGEEKAELNAAYDSTWLSMGPRVKQFEARMADYIGIKNAVAVSNGTDALDLAFKAIGIKPGDEIIVPAMTYIASVSSVLYQFARPVFADIELDTYNIDVGSAKKLISKKTKCILYIDYGGNPADHDALKKLSEDSGIPLVQDAAQSLGAEYNGEKLCKQGVIATTSFHTAKLMTTVEGGMVFTRDDELAQKIRIMRNQGEDPEQKYIHVMLGTNARMTDLQAAIGLRQLDRLERIVSRRREIAEYYFSKLSGIEQVTLPKARKKAVPSWFFVPVLVENRDLVAQKLRECGIDTRIAYPMPVYEQPFFSAFSEGKAYNCRNAKWMTERVLNLPIYHKIKNDQLDYIIDKLIDAVKHNA